MININKDDLNALVTFCDYIIDSDVINDELTVEESYNKNKDLIISLFEQFMVDQLNLNGGNL